MNALARNIILILLLLVSCDKNSQFPSVDVNISIPITMPQYSNIYNNLWGYEYINGGVGGIILMQGMDEFIAYDRSCTNEKNSNCIISGDNPSDLILTCLNCCSSKFIITDGSVSEGPANQALKKYNTFFDGELLYITN